MWQNIYDLSLPKIHALISGNVPKLLVDRILQVFIVQNLIFQRETSCEKYLLITQWHKYIVAETRYS